MTPGPATTGEGAGVRRGRGRRVLAALSPESLAYRFPGPLFQKEVRVQGRRAAAYWTRAIYTCLLLGLIAVFYFSTRPMAGVTGATQRLQQLQIVAPSLTVSLGWLQFVVLPLIAASLAAPSVCEELRSGTLGTLLTTPLSARQIVLGKMLSAGVQLVVLALIAAPVLLAIRVFGGVEARSIVAISALTLTTAALACGVGVLFSILSGRAAGAMVASIAMTAVLLLWPIFTLAMLDLAGVNTGKPVLGFVFEYAHIAWKPPTYLELATALSPPLAMGMVSYELMGGGLIPGLGTSLLTTWLCASAYNLAATGGVFALASVALRRMMRRVGAGPAAPGAKGAPSRTTEETPRRAARRRARRHRSRVVGDDPVLWRELSLSGFTSRITQLLLVGTVLGLLCLVYGLAGTRDIEPHMVIAVVGVVVMLAMGAVGTTGGITGEREARSWELLLTTPLSARQIILGKFAGAVRRQWIAPALLLGTIAVLGVGARTFHPVVLPHLLLAIAPPLLAMSALGVLLSLTRKRTASAAVISFAAWAALWMIVPAMSAMMMGLMASYGSRDLTMMLNVEMAVNPVFLAVTAIAGAGWRDWGTNPDSYNTWPEGAMSALEFSAILMAQAFFYLLLTGAFLHLAAVILAQHSSRRR